VIAEGTETLLIEEKMYIMETEGDEVQVVNLYKDNNQPPTIELSE